MICLIHLEYITIHTWTGIDNLTGENSTPGPDAPASISLILPYIHAILTHILTTNMYISPPYTVSIILLWFLVDFLSILKIFIMAALPADGRRPSSARFTFSFITFEPRLRSIWNLVYKLRWRWGIRISHFYLCWASFRCRKWRPNFRDMSWKWATAPWLAKTWPQLFFGPIRS